MGERRSNLTYYVRFLMDLIGGSEYDGRSYEKLLWALYHKEFIWTVNMDENRAADAIEMRSEYEREFKSRVIGDNPRLLEVMVALACRCEDNIMGDNRYGNRVPKWFWSMIESADLLDFDDENYDENADFVDEKLDILLSRRYSRDGKGGLFYIKNCKKDMRKAEIWYQMCWWLSANFSTDIEEN